MSSSLASFPWYKRGSVLLSQCCPDRHPSFRSLASVRAVVEPVWRSGCRLGALEFPSTAIGERELQAHIHATMSGLVVTDGVGVIVQFPEAGKMPFAVRFEELRWLDSETGDDSGDVHTSGTIPDTHRHSRHGFRVWHGLMTTTLVIIRAIPDSNILVLSTRMIHGV